MLTGFPAEGGSSSGSAVVPYTFTNRDVMLYALGGWSTEFVLSCSYMSLHSCTLYSAMYIYLKLSFNTIGSPFNAPM